MHNNIIKSWKCWYTDSNNNVHEHSSTRNNTQEIPSNNLQAIKLWFEAENACRFISGNLYYIFNNINNIVGQPSSCIMQTDFLNEQHSQLVVKQSSPITEDLYMSILDKMIEAEDPTL